MVAEETGGWIIDASGDRCPESPARSAGLIIAPRHTYLNAGTLAASILKDQKGDGLPRSRICDAGTTHAPVRKRRTADHWRLVDALVNLAGRRRRTWSSMSVPRHDEVGCSDRPCVACRSGRRC